MMSSLNVVYDPETLLRSISRSSVFILITERVDIAWKEEGDSRSVVT
jgi:hypothetical protein